PAGNRHAGSRTQGDEPRPHRQLVVGSVLPASGTVGRVFLRRLRLPVPLAVPPVGPTPANSVLAAPCRHRTSTWLREPAQRQGGGTGRSGDGRRRRVLPDPATESHRRRG